MIFGDFDRIIFRDFKEEAAWLILDEIEKQKPVNEHQLAGMIADLGAQALINTCGSVCILTNIKGLYEEWEESRGASVP